VGSVGLGRGRFDCGGVGYDGAVDRRNDLSALWRSRACEFEVWQLKEKAPGYKEIVILMVTGMER
jgi:hypothetical protein